MMLLFAELSLASEIIGYIFALLVFGFICYIFYKDYQRIKQIREQERVFKEQLLLHYKNIDNNLSALCENLDEDIVFD